MDFQEKLDEFAAYVDGAWSLPMSSSVVINKKEVDEFLAELRESLPEDLVAAKAVLRRRDELLSEAAANAHRLLAAAEEEQQRMVSEDEIVRLARIQAGTIVRAAEDKAEQVSRDVDEYVDSKLAHLEVSVNNILDTVRHGRERLAGPGVYAELAPPADGTDRYAELAPEALEAKADAGVVEARQQPAEVEARSEPSDAALEVGAEESDARLEAEAEAEESDARLEAEAEAGAETGPAADRTPRLPGNSEWSVSPDGADDEPHLLGPPGGGVPEPREASPAVADDAAGYAGAEVPVKD